MPEELFNKPDPQGGDNAQKATKADLEAIIARIEKLEDEKAEITLDISEILKEAKGNGYDPKIIRKMIAFRKWKKEEREQVRFYADVLEIFGWPFNKRKKSLNSSP